MSDYNFYQSIQVRYGDLDPQGHVNNARTVTFLEHARLEYICHLGLWDGVSFADLGLIVADVHVNYLWPILLNQAVRIGVRTSRLGNKSLTFVYQVEDEQTGQVFARGESVMVTYDYHTHTTVPIPQDWREKIAAFDSIPLQSP